MKASQATILYAKKSSGTDTRYSWETTKGSEIGFTSYTKVGN
jgi:hypothetical protein